MIALHFYVCLFSPAAAEGEMERENTRFCYFNANFLCKRIHLMWIIFAKTTLEKQLTWYLTIYECCSAFQKAAWVPQRSTSFTQLYALMTDFSLGDVNNFRWASGRSKWGYINAMEEIYGLFCSFDAFYVSPKPELFILTSLVWCLAAVENIEVAAGGWASGCRSHCFLGSFTTLGEGIKTTSLG